MTTPLLELEGTWEEIVAQIPDFSGQKLRVLVYPATGHNAEGHIPVTLPRCWPRLPRPSPPESLPSYHQTLPTNWTTISTAPPSDEAGPSGYTTKLATTSWLIVIFGELVQSRGILRYHKGLWPLNSVHSSPNYSHPPVGSA